MQLHAFQRELAQVDVAPTIAAGDIVVGVVAHALAQRVLVHGHVVVVHVGQPVDHVAAPVEACTARCIAHGQVHLAAGQVQVFGDLRSGLARAHHQHGAIGQRLRVAVLLGMDLHDARRQALGQARDDGHVVAARGHDHLVGGAHGHLLTLRCVHLVAALWARHHPAHRHAFTQRGVHLLPEAGQVVVDLVLLHEAMRVVACIGVAGQLALPVGRDQAEAVPALGAPAVQRSVLLEHHMAGADLLQVVAHRQAGLAAADDDDFVVVWDEGRGGSVHGGVLAGCKAW